MKYKLFSFDVESDVEIDIKKKELRVLICDVINLIEIHDCIVDMITIKNKIISVYSETKQCIARHCECGEAYLEITEYFGIKNRNPHPENGCKFHLVKSVLES